jgi:hypothetical protein
MSGTRLANVLHKTLGYGLIGFSVLGLVNIGSYYHYRYRFGYKDGEQLQHPLEEVPLPPLLV